MKIKFIIIITFVHFLGFSQNDTKLQYKKDYITYKGCDDAEDKAKCFDSKLLALLNGNITNELKDIIFKQKEKDTLTISTLLNFDEQGILIPNFSRLYSNIKEIEKPLKTIINDNIPKVKPLVDSFGNNVAEIVNSISTFKINREQQIIIPLEGFIPEKVSFSTIERVPIYRGCSESLDNVGLKKCMNQGVKKHIQKKFNTRLASKSRTPSGIVSISIFFSVNKKGKVVNIKARSSNKAIEKEAIRVIKSMPKFKKPGSQRDQAVTVTYFIPIKFKV